MQLVILCVSAILSWAEVTKVSPTPVILSPSPWASTKASPSPTYFPSPTISTKASPTPTMPIPGINQCAFQFTCMCNKTGEVSNCGTLGGNPCSCNQVPPQPTCDSGGTAIYVYCHGTTSGSCTGGSAPNSFTPPLQRNQCRLIFTPDWMVTASNSNCSMGYHCPDPNNSKPLGGCTLGAVVNVSPGCTH